MQLTHGLHRSARLRPDAIALVGDGRRVTHTGLLDRVARLAGAFREAGLEPGGRVAILAPNGPALIETTFAALWAGGVAVPVNWRFSPPEMRDQVADADPTVLVADGSFAAAAADLAGGLPGLRAVLVVGGSAEDRPAGARDYEAAIAAETPAEDAGRRGDDLAAIYYTGGTTGRSKGVMLTHANLWANAVATSAVLGFDDSLVHLHTGPLFHLGAAARLFTTAIVGGRHVVAARFRPEEALSLIATERVTVSTFVPTMLDMIVDAPVDPGLDLGCLGLITYGAAPMPERTLRRSLERFPNARFAQSYGMTELSPVATMLTPADHAPGAPPHRLRSAGRPIFSADVRVARPDGRDVVPGEAGEILVRGPMVMAGYWRRPEQSAEALRGGWMHTGDVGRFDPDGYLYVTDRIKDMIITGGENVFSTEVEDALGSHPAVGQCAVIGLPDPRWGERVHAVVVLRDGAAAPNPDDLIAHCRPLLAGYKIPRGIAFHDGPLPLSSVGKIGKAELRARYASLGAVLP